MFKRLAFFLLGCLFLVAATSAEELSFSFQPPSPWKKGGIQAVDSSWMLENSPTKASLTVTVDRSGGGLGPEDFNRLKGQGKDGKDSEDKLFHAVELTRSVPLGIFGITDWKIEKHRITPLPEGGTLVEMKGHYRATSGTPVRFVERDYFVGKSSYLVSFFEDDDGSPLQSDSGVEKLLDLFKVLKAPKMPKTEGAQP